MADYDLGALDREYEERIFNEGPIEDEDELREYFEARGIDPDNMPVDFQVWDEGEVEIVNKPDQSEWINIGTASRFIDVLADGTHITPSGESGGRTAEVLTWLKQSCKGAYIVRCDSSPDDGSDIVGYEVMLLDKNDLMLFKLKFTGFI